MTHSQIVEIVALTTGLLVISIETVIIFLLERHIKILDKHLKKNESLMVDFEHKIAEHIDHLHEHTHAIDEQLKQICEGKVKIH